MPSIQFLPYNEPDEVFPAIASHVPKNRNRSGASVVILSVVRSHPIPD